MLGFYAGTLARVRGRGVNEKCILENPTNKPKPAYFAYQNLCALIDKSYEPMDVESHTDVTDSGIFYGIGVWEDAFPSVPLVACFQKKDGRFLLAHWLPWHGQEYLPELAKINLVVKKINRFYLKHLIQFCLRIYKEEMFKIIFNYLLLYYLYKNNICIFK
jgi:hypothetical protein